MPSTEVRREVGPFVVGLGGVLAIAGSLLPWAVVHFSPRFLGIELSQLFQQTHHVMGTDVADGKITLALGAVLALLGIGGVLLASRELRADMALVAAVGGVALVGLGVYELFRIQDTTTDNFNPFRADRPLTNLHLRRLLNVSTGYGIYLVVAGGVIVAVGAALMLRRLRSAPASTAPASDET